MVVVCTEDERNFSSDAEKYIDFDALQKEEEKARPKKRARSASEESE